MGAPPPVTLGQVLEQQRALVTAAPDSSAAQNDLGNLLLLAGARAGAGAAVPRAVAVDRFRLGTNLGLLLQSRGRVCRGARLPGGARRPDHAGALPA